MTVLRSVALFVLAAIAEIGGAWLVWQGVREHRGLLWIGAGVLALGGYGFVATLQPDPHFGRILAAYGGVFVAGSLAWGMVVDGYRPDRYDAIGAVICLIGVVVIMYAPRHAQAGMMAAFSAYGPSHWTVLAVTAVGAVALVALGRRGAARLAGPGAKVLAVVLLALALSEHIWAFDPAHITHTLPLHLSDLAPYVGAYALWTRRRGACALTYYWGITLSTQSLITPALVGPDFPSPRFLVFFASHVFVVWAAIFLTWGLRLPPDWRGYRFTVAVTACWAAATLAFNELAGTNYGFLNAKPETGSILDLLGPWPWYLVPEVALLLVVWALMTAPWQRHHPDRLGTGKRSDGRSSRRRTD